MTCLNQSHKFIELLVWIRIWKVENIKVNGIESLHVYQFQPRIMIIILWTLKKTKNFRKNDNNASKLRMTVVVAAKSLRKHQTMKKNQIIFIHHLNFKSNKFLPAATNQVINSSKTSI